MSEFKFACPVCGQHITADASTSGGQIDCPTCFQKIVVPQAPATSDTKLVLSAAQVAKPRPLPTEAASQLGPLQPAPRRTSLAAIIALIALLCAAGAAVFVFHERITKALHGPTAAATNAPAQQQTAPTVLNTKYPVPTNAAWTMDLANAVIPETTAAGSVHGSGFFCEKAVLRGGSLSLNQGKRWPWDLAVAVNLYAHQGEELSGKTVEITPDRPRAPRVYLRWKNEEQKPAYEAIHRGYALKLVFGQATNGHMPGSIYICLPDADKSFVAGTFDAEIRKPPPPKAPKPKG
jgi:hypothetical protein